jgi:methionyl-tRNA synthetase
MSVITVFHYYNVNPSHRHIIFSNVYLSKLFFILYDICHKRKFFIENLSLNFRHIIGKDIIWFHCVIWPCILMSAGIPLPTGVFSHGFVNADDGRKMSKSYNNAVDPHDVSRYFFSNLARIGIMGI